MRHSCSQQHTCIDCQLPMLSGLRGTSTAQTKWLLFTQLDQIVWSITKTGACTAKCMASWASAKSKERGRGAIEARWLTWEGKETDERQLHWWRQQFRSHRRAFWQWEARGSQDNRGNQCQQSVSSKICFQFTSAIIRTGVQSLSELRLDTQRPELLPPSIYLPSILPSSSPIIAWRLGMGDSGRYPSFCVLAIYTLKDLERPSPARPTSQIIQSQAAWFYALFFHSFASPAWRTHVHEKAGGFWRDCFNRSHLLFK